MSCSCLSRFQKSSLVHGLNLVCRQSPRLFFPECMPCVSCDVFFPRFKDVLPLSLGKQRDLPSAHTNPVPSSHTRTIPPTAGPRVSSDSRSDEMHARQESDMRVFQAPCRWLPRSIDFHYWKDRMTFLKVLCACSFAHEWLSDSNIVPRASASL